MSWVTRTAHEDGGSAVVEFALVLPLLLVVTLALVEVGLVVRDRLLVESSARAGARAAALSPDPGLIRGAVERAAPTLDGGALGVSVAREGGRGDPVTVTVTYGSAVRVPFIAWLMRGTIRMAASATDRQEFT